MQRNTRNLSVTVLVGVIVGLIIASSFDFQKDGLADNSEQPKYNNAASLPEVDTNLESASRAFVAVAKHVTPTVVSITSEKVVQVRDPFSNFFHGEDFFRRFFRTPDRGPQEYRQQGLGSGVIVTADGYILTNYHVVKDADEVNVVIDTDEIDAEIIGTDPATDLAVIKIDRRDLPSAVLGDSDKLEVGEWVLAIGNPFDLNLNHTVTSGIISAKGRQLGRLSRDLTYQDFIQTDAAINPGNSGGALVNVRGELIGINTAIYSGNGGGNVGIGFAIPINLAKRVMDDLITKGRVVRGYLGVYIDTPDEEISQALGLKDKKGALVNQVADGAPADNAGLEAGDVIVEVNGKGIDDAQMLTNLIASYAPGETVTLKIIRNQESLTKKVTLAERDTTQVASAPENPADMRTRLGIDVQDLTSALAKELGYEGFEGVVVSGVQSGSVAAEKGLREGDLILSVDRKKVRNVEEFVEIVEGFDVGEIVLLQVRRQETNSFLALKIPEK